MEEPPLTGRPEGYSGAVGTFRISTQARPRDVCVGQPIRFTIQVLSTGPVSRRPSPVNLEAVLKFAKLFVIARLKDGVESYKAGIWEWQYDLFPRSTEATEIPAVRFDYFRPGIVPPEKGYQTT